MTRKFGIAKPNCPNLKQGELTTYDPTTQPLDEPLRYVDTQSRITDEYTQSRIAVAPLDEDRLEEIITDSIDLDWTPRDAARAIVRAMKGDQS